MAASVDSSEEVITSGVTLPKCSLSRAMAALLILSFVCELIRSDTSIYRERSSLEINRCLVNLKATLFLRRTGSVTLLTAHCVDGRVGLGAHCSDIVVNGRPLGRLWLWLELWLFLRLWLEVDTRLKK